MPNRNGCRLRRLMIWAFLVFCAACVMLGGCSMRKLTVGQMGRVMVDGFPAYLKEPDPVLVQDSMAANLKLIEALLESDPKNEDLLLLACQGFASHAFLFVEHDNSERAKGLYLRARDYGHALLDRRGLVPESEYSPDAWDQALSNADKNDAPAIFWSAFAWGGRIQLDRESPVALADLPIVIRMVEHAARLDPGYWFAGPDTFLGFYHGSVPVPLGGQPETARAHFENALSLTDRQSLMIQLLYARSYAVQVQDRTLFQELLIEIRDADPEKMPPETALSNALARIRAGELMARTDEFFQ